jgi:hypothetical protein
MPLLIFPHFLFVFKFAIQFGPNQLILDVAGLLSQTGDFWGNCCISCSLLVGSSCISLPLLGHAAGNPVPTLVAAATVLLPSCCLCQLAAITRLIVDATIFNNLQLYVF